MNLRNIIPHFLEPQKGRLLISEPFITDLQFKRSVILIGDHNEEGSVGFILNKPMTLLSNEVVPDLLNYNFPLFYGGPVEPNTLHFIHKVGALIENAQPIGNGIYWGGDMDMVNDLLKRKVVTPDEFRFFVGYSGWASNQLQDEIEEKAWWVAEGNDEIVFDDDLENMWKRIVSSLGDDYAYMANSPEDPTWN